MINGISSWAEQVIIAVIIGTIIEMILPKGNTEKYIKTVIGIYILYTIISPVIGAFTGKNLKLAYSDYEKYFNYTDEQEKVKDEVNNVDTNIIENTYKTEIERQIKHDIEGMGFKLNAISLDFTVQEGNIKNVNLIVNKKEKESENNKIAINNIEIGKDENKIEENNLTRQEIEKIKEKLNEDYGIDKEEIRINSI